MKNNTISRLLLMLFCLCIFQAKINAQTYTSVYNNVTYTSSQPYNLTVIYFVPNDVPLDVTYKKRLSECLIWGQDFYKRYMIANGFGPKTFGLFKEANNQSNVKIILIHGNKPGSSYPYENTSNLLQEVNAYFASNPTHKTSVRSLIFTAGNANTASAAFFGQGLNAFAFDQPELDLQHLHSPGTNGDITRSLFGGMLHELAHVLLVPHSHQTNTENNDPNKGMSLMSRGNHTLGTSTHTFLNRAACAILNNNQLLAPTPGGTYRNGNDTKLKSLNTTFADGNLIVSGTFESNRVVTDVNIYQDPYATPSQGYDKVAWSVTPTGNSFSVSMPVNELQKTTGTYNLQVELVLNNEEIYNAQPLLFNYNNGIPDIENSTFVGGSLSLTTNLNGVSYQWQYLTPSGTWKNFIEGTVTGWGKFQGSQTKTLNISNVSSLYLDKPETARVVVKMANGSTVYGNSQIWNVYGGITTQPKPVTTACVGGSIQLSAQAHGSAYQWQYQSAYGTWINFTEGNLPGFATFTGTKSPNLTISNISGYYTNQFDKARLLVYGGKNNYVSSDTALWKAENVNITSQPPASLSACIGGTIQMSASASGAASYQWQYMDGNGNWRNFTEGTVSGYATFTGTKTPTLAISNIAALYSTYTEKARLLVTGAGGCSVATNTVLWRAENVKITSQPPASLSPCVGGTLQMSAAASGATSYQWQYMDGNGNWRNFTDGTVGGYATFTGTKSPTLTISNIAAIYSTYTEKARLLVTGAGGCSIATNTVLWRASYCNGKNAIASKVNTSEKMINKITTDDRAQSVYPNPVKDELTVDLGSTGDKYMVQILNISGQMIYQITTSESLLKIPFSDKPAANYLVVITNISNESKKTFKVIKN